MNNLFSIRNLCNLLLFALLLSTFFTTTASIAGTFIQLSENDTFKDILFGTEQSYAKLGITVVSGDFNGDNIDDLAISSPGEYTPAGTAKAGFVGIFFGGPSFSSLPAEVITGNAPADMADTKIFGSAANDSIGWKMVAGDLNNDGKDDLVISAANTSNPQQDSSGDLYEVFIVFGNTVMASEIILNPSSTDPKVSKLSRDYMHVSALSIGDLDGDGTNDLAVSDILTGLVSYPPMRSGRTTHGAVYVLKGQASWPSTINLATNANRTFYRSDTTLDSGTFRAYALAIGDLVGGDGKADLVLGASKEGSANKNGKVYIVPGGTDFFTEGSVIDNAATSIISSPIVNDYIGGTLAIGNINKDAYPDLLIGSPMSFMAVEENASAVGKVDVILGRAIGLPANVNLANDGDVLLKMKPYTTTGGLGRLQTETGRSLLAKDVNGDQTDDIIIGSPGASFDPLKRDNGIIHIVYGKSNFAAEYLLDTDYDMAIAGPNSNDKLADSKLGASIAVGDFNANNKPDIILSAPESVGPFTKTLSGVVLVLFDEAVPLSSEFDWNIFLPAILKHNR